LTGLKVHFWSKNKSTPHFSLKGTKGKHTIEKPQLNLSKVQIQENREL
jgi:hypothetical protein